MFHPTADTYFTTFNHFTCTTSAPHPSWRSQKSPNLQRPTPVMADAVKRSEGEKPRKRAVLSCVECQKRRKKCDEVRPVCSNCSKRFPPVQCVYQPRKTTTKSHDSDAGGSGRSSRILQNSTRRLAPKIASPPTDSGSPSGPSQLPTPPRDPHATHELSTRLSRISVTSSRTDGRFQSSFSSTSTRPAIVGKNYHSPSNSSEEDDNIDARLLGGVAGDGESQRDTANNMVAGNAWNSLQFDERDVLINKGLPPSKNLAELLIIYKTKVSPATTSIDASKTPELYTSEWAHYGSMSQLLTKAHLYAAAGWAHAMLPDWHATLPKVKQIAPEDCNSQIVVWLRVDLMHEINRRLRLAKPNVDDDTLASVIPFIHEEWMYPPGPRPDSMHVQGLKQMLNLRRGVRNLGMNGVLAKFIILYAYHGAVSTGTEPFLPRSERLIESFLKTSPPRAHMHSPLLFTNFSESRGKLGISNQTARLLDEVARITAAVHAFVGGKYSDLEDAVAQAGRVVKLLMVMPPNTQDPIFEACRLASILYLDSINARKPLPLTLFPDATATYVQLLIHVKTIRPNAFKGLEGVWLWLTIVASYCSFGRPEAVMWRTWQHACAMNMALENWPMLCHCFERFLSIQEWTKPLKEVEESKSHSTHNHKERVHMHSHDKFLEFVAAHQNP